MTIDIGASAGGLTGRRHGTFHPLRVGHVERLTEDAVAITFDVPEELREDYAFTHGQHLTVRTEIDGVEVRRNYSICAPATSGRLRIGVKHLRGGAFSGHATSALRVGDVVEVMTPTGRFFTALDPAQAKHYCAVAAGSGITPVLSILTTVLEVEPRSTVTLVYGNRTTASVMFLDEIADLKDRYPTRFRLVNVLSREPQEVELFSGRIDADKMRRLLATLLPSVTVDEWFLCGPFAMVEEAREVLRENGVALANVHTELFHVDGEAPRKSTAVDDVPAEGSSTVTVTLDGRASTLQVPRSGVRILDAVLTVRTDAPYACKGGVCGTCRARLVTGEVAMERNYALEPDEVEAGFVLACQSRPVTDEVVLDFDA
ncbi:MAG: phenylacetate-CoA oxygenase/reductase subunit PaaK [Spirochaetaceae bacterium]|nr:phenylacetate-CoA oxygenase/reductase subunit PaaK [Spirochaetaceae bacterium]